MEQVNRLELYKVKFHQIIMLTKRGYSHTKKSDIEKQLITRNPLESLEIFDSVYYKPALARNEVIESELSGIYVHNKNPDDKINVLYVNVKGKGEKEPEKILKAVTDQIIEMINNQPLIHVILVSKVDFSAQNYRELLKLSAYWIEHFLYEELFYDPLRHVMQPKFKLLTEQESEDYLKSRKDDSGKLKKYCIDDPVVKFLGARAGQVVKIELKVRNKGITNISFDSRIVTNESIYHEQKKQ
jgi:DNA-directed RNA polymerase subunit H (RpoH/RPB5)